MPPRSPRSLLRHGLCALLTAAGLLIADDSFALVTHIPAPPQCTPQFHGFNMVEGDQAPLGSPQSYTSLRELRGTGANAVAIVPFLQQTRPDSTDVTRDSDTSDGELARTIREAHKLGLATIIKPQLQIPGSAPDDVRLASDKDWSEWFHNYEQTLVGLAAVAKDEHAEALVIGTDLDQSLDRPEWLDLIARLRRIYRGRLVYAAQGAKGAEQVPFWNKLDAVGVTLFPVLNAGDDPAAWQAAAASERDRLLALAKQTKRHIFVAELGIRSAPGASGQADDAQQARALATWLAGLSDPLIHTVLIWSWNETPDHDQAAASAFPVKGTIAEQALASQWRSCKQTLVNW